MKTFFTLIFSFFMISVYAQTKDMKVKTVIFVHGAFADGSSWNKVIPMLQAKGIKVVSVQNPLSSLTDDVAAAKRAIDAQSENVLLVGHSWGGTVITEAGNHEKVAGLFYIAGFAPNDNQSTAESTKDYPPSPGLAHPVVDASGFMSLNNESISKDFAQDLPTSETNIMMATQGHLAGKCLNEKVTNAAWKNKTNFYIVTSNDRMIQPEAQKAFAKKMNAKTTTLKSGHVPFLSKPKDVANAILSAIKGLNSVSEPKAAQADSF